MIFDIMCLTIAYCYFEVALLACYYRRIFLYCFDLVTRVKHSICPSLGTMMQLHSTQKITTRIYFHIYSMLRKFVGMGSVPSSCRNFELITGRFAQFLRHCHRCGRSCVLIPGRSNRIQYRQRLATAKMFLELCCPGGKPRRWNSPLVACFGLMTPV